MKNRAWWRKDSREREREEMMQHRNKTVEYGTVVVVVVKVNQ
jgi:hypothetical protein